MGVRKLERVIEGKATSDGAGVRLRRSLGQSGFTRLDPFLMLDEFNSEDSADYIAGFPSHPHRGFETVTYMLLGHMLHEDHMGNKGHLQAGDVQWMTAGRGVIHSEMPQQEDGRMHGFQLWINLPAAEKMKPASYRDIPCAEIPSVAIEGMSVKIIAGSFNAAGQTTTGPISGLSTQPLYFDVELKTGSVLQQVIPEQHAAFVYVYSGSVSIGERALVSGQAGILTDGDEIAVKAGDQGARFLLLAGKPLNEPIVQHGPFVMNTREEIEQALRDYANGNLTG